MNVMLTSKDASARMRRWQRGGTVTGVIVGLIVGLTVAVWVAMTILKTPLPFVDKISKQSQPAGELGDPNKTMPGGARAPALPSSRSARARGRPRQTRPRRSGG